MNNDTLFPIPAPEPRPLSEAERRRLLAAGASICEIRACERVMGCTARRNLIACFCEAARNNWHKLKVHVAYLLWLRDSGLPVPIGGEVLTHTVGGRWRGCKGNQTHRLIFSRLVIIVRPDLRGLLSMKTEARSNTNAVLLSGWTPPKSEDWMAIEPAEQEGVK